MNIFEKSRFAVYSKRQHPFAHSASEFYYANPLLPGVVNMEDALNYLTSVMYPNYIGTFATPAALPGVATNNDYAVVTDDGDGKSAGYVYQTLDGVSQWIKRYDVDWSLENIFAETINRTQYMYVHKYGFDDHDAVGVPLAGVYAGQTIYGGASAGTNLTFNANSNDGLGFVQSDNTFRPTSHNALDLGENLTRWRTGYFGTSVLASTLTLAGGSITDSSGAISFDNENLTTTGNITGTTGYFTSSVEVGALLGNALILGPGSITDESGAISFGNENLTTTGNITGAQLAVVVGLNSLTISDGATKHVVASTYDLFDFEGGSFEDIGNIAALTANFTTSVQGGNLLLSGNTLAAQNLNGNVNLLADGIGIVDIQSPLFTLAITATGAVAVTGSLDVDNIKLDGNGISITNVNGNLQLAPNGTGILETTKSFKPASDGDLNLGDATHRFNDLFMDGAISDGTTSISSTTVQSLRDINVGVAAGMSLFWDGAKWVASVPDSEVDHGSISGLADDDHTQYALLAGRAGGQSLIGGTAASEDLTLESTAHATKGAVKTKDNFVPFTNASFGVGWTGTDLGDATHFFRDLYMRGEARNLRVENFTTAGLPGFSAANVGRLLIDTDISKLYFDKGTALEKILSGSVALGSEVSGTLPIGNGGTGQTTATNAFNALAPATAKGGLIAGTGVNTYGNLAATTNGYVLTLDSAEATGMKWALASGSGGGGGLKLTELTNAPTMISDYNVTAYKFEATLGQQLYLEWKVPSAWVAKAVQLILPWYTPATTNSVDWKAECTLVRTNTDAIDSTANQQTFTRSDGVPAVTRRLTYSPLNICDNSGQINSVTLQANDIVKVRLYRDSADTCTSEALLIPSGVELKI